MTVLLCGSSQTHLGTLMPSGGGHIIKASLKYPLFIDSLLSPRAGSLEIEEV